MVLKTFGWSFGITVAALVGSLFLWGPTGAALIAILIVLEVSLSFDNAVVNAKVLERMSPYWQKMFLTVGMLIAVFGMRLIFPLVLVAFTAGLGPIEVFKLALDGGPADQVGTYAYELHHAHPALASFGGMFLLMLFLNFIFDDHDYKWLHWIERPLSRVGKIDTVEVIVGLGVLLLATQYLADGSHTVLVSGALGMLVYLAVDSLAAYFEGQHEATEEAEAAEAAAHPGQAIKLATGKAAFMLFMYLEVLDSSFSFDGVIGAFAITSNIFEIAIGLGVGALYIRSLTIFLVRKGTLSDYVYLEHGAMWAIGALAFILFLTLQWEIPEVVTGLIGVCFILASLGSSLAHRKREGALA
ncbi:DUF475 domain-containing protein [Nocardioides sp.]|jgi:uncharacterized protein|uniref:DUF475 domain-containing protein n=1 Tax=Nocardioides sp. TaxID=35761 RepID=UPI0026185E92|nr:DUF475 domain-containing protein [Nocardioides sp.]